MIAHETILRSRRLARALVAAACIAALVGCGSGDEAPKAPPGSPENPLIAKPAGGSSAGRSGRAESASTPKAAGYDAILAQQREARRGGATPSTGDEGNPCRLVTKAEAETILGARLLDPLVAPQGPTCVYRNRSGSSFATVAVESLDFDDVRPGIRRTERVAISGRSAYCGVRGRPILYLPLSHARVLSVAAPCDTAVRFARRAAPRLG